MQSSMTTYNGGSLKSMVKQRAAARETDYAVCEAHQDSPV